MYHLYANGIYNQTLMNSAFIKNHGKLCSILLLQYSQQTNQKIKKNMHRFRIIITVSYT